MVGTSVSHLFLPGPGPWSCSHPTHGINSHSNTRSLPPLKNSTRSLPPLKNSTRSLSVHDSSSPADLLSPSLLPSLIPGRAVVSYPPLGKETASTSMPSTRCKSRRCDSLAAGPTPRPAMPSSRTAPVLHTSGGRRTYPPEAAFAPYPPCATHSPIRTGSLSSASCPTQSGVILAF
jgi:hypothetical protein